jgi:3-oxoacyl-[acyl-carrier-protein] synthase-1
MVFVYTLANIVTGEIALRNRYYGETNFYVLPQKDEKVMTQIVEDSFQDEHTTSAICGWLNCDDEDYFEADLYLVEK